MAQIMPRSMTAYGRAVCTASSGRWVVELHSVNRKMLDLNVVLPKEILFLDLEVRKLLSKEIERGQVTARIYLEDSQLKISVKTFKKLKQKWDRIAVDLGFDPKKAITLEFLTEKLESEPSLCDEKSLKMGLSQVVEAALKPFAAMKEKEGEVLAKEMSRRLQMIRAELQAIEKIFPRLRQQYQDKLKQRILNYMQKQDDQAVLREVVIYAERIDISEEIERLYSHIGQFKEVLVSKEKSVGRILDFLTQEMGREINTLTAKSGDSEISKLAVVIKGEIEKIREQVQNIE